MFDKISSGCLVFRVEVTTALVFASTPGTLELVAPPGFNIGNFWDGLVKCVDG
jgi:hypothetical protein